MPRHKTKEFARDVGVDQRYGSQLVQKLINTIMRCGKKNVARSIVYGAIGQLLKKTNGDEKKAVEMFYRAIERATPVVEVRPRRVGGSVYQIPVEVPPRRRQALAFRWIITAAQARPGKTMGERLADELMDAFEGKERGAIKKKSDVQRMAEANRAFSHYAW